MPRHRGEGGRGGGDIHDLVGQGPGGFHRYPRHSGRISDKGREARGRLRRQHHGDSLRA